MPVRSGSLAPTSDPENQRLRGCSPPAAFQQIRLQISGTRRCAHHEDTLTGLLSVGKAFVLFCLNNHGDQRGSGCPGDVSAETHAGGACSRRPAGSACLVSARPLATSLWAQARQRGSGFPDLSVLTQGRIQTHLWYQDVKGS